MPASLPEPSAALSEEVGRTPVELLAFVAHELRSPLAPIRTAAALMAIGGPEQLQRARAIIERQVMHMDRMIDGLLDLSRSGTGKLRRGWGWASRSCANS